MKCFFNDKYLFLRKKSDINIWHQFVEFEGRSRSMVEIQFTLTQFWSRVGIYLFYSFLQIYKLRGSYIKECKNHYRNSGKLKKKFCRKFCFLGVSCMFRYEPVEILELVLEIPRSLGRDLKRLPLG